MNFNSVQDFALFHGLTPLKRVTHSTGAEIFIAEKYANSDPEFDKPHYQTWMHVSFGEDRPLVGQKLFFNFRNQVSRSNRIEAAEKSADTLIRHVVDAYGREHG
ncbi:MAG: hypothetical protein ACR2OV_15845 [Hyphomicrobiaceae bacterium]